MQASAEFDKRVRSIARKNRQLARGRKTYVDETGVIRHRAVRQKSAIPFKAIVLFALGFIAFKSLVLASAGAEDYAKRLALLETGTLFERAGAWALQIDPVTEFVGTKLDPLFM